VRATVVKRDITAFRSCQYDAFVSDAQELHLVHLQFISLRNGDRLALPFVDRLLAPFAGPCVSVIDTESGGWDAPARQPCFS